VIYSKTHIPALILLSVSLAAVQPGCSGLPVKFVMPKVVYTKQKTKPKPPAPKAASKPAPTRVRTSGDGYALGDVEQPGLSPQQFVDKIEELLKARQATTAARCVQRYPDVALAVLREPGTVQATAETLQAVARAHDSQCTHAPAEAGWTALILDRLRQPNRYVDYDRKRKEFMTLVQSGHAEKALEIGITAPPQGVPGSMLSIDAYQLTGIGKVLANRPKEAAEAFNKATRLARADHPYQAANLLLLQSDALRRAGDSAGAEASWHEATEVAAELTIGPKAVADPILWERAAYLRPANSIWSPAVQGQLAQVNVPLGIAAAPRNPIIPVSSGGSVSDEASLWSAIGHWRLTRGEPQAALVAFKRSEAMTSDNYVAGRLRLAQAKAMLRMGQSSAASAILISLAQDNDPRLSHPAMAALGTLKLEQGGTQQGFNLLRKAVEEENFPWPERSEAEADLGLAYLLMGEQQPGLNWLHNAQQNFDAAGEPEQLIQCFENEAAYLEKFGQKAPAQAIRQHLASLQSDAL
jgi:tetratricopeptide (TPR) repeat protein